MFTGLVEITGALIQKSNTKEGCEFLIEAILEENDLKIGDSISINGACHTVTELQNGGKRFGFYSSYKTLELTNLGDLQPGDLVNLERAMKANQRFGGHIVQGHIDGVGEILSRDVRDNGKVEVFFVRCPDELTKYVVMKGSISIDGISLTVVSIESSKIELVLIPETLKKTNAQNWNIGRRVNVEVDLIARHLEKLIVK
ncbi:MAG: riboflavin synthase [Leptospiraceae bacterium]|nr:riboflavin synthase [Leptospiraceae bacterium]